jgi:glycosyltransferase involved in cell wall biosynthesis
MSSILEGNPISLLEAMGMGLVPVTTSVGGLPEMIENAVNGLMVPPSEPKLLANALRIPLENPDLAQEWSRKSRELILKEYTAEIMAEKHENLYLNLIKGKREK